MAKKRIIGFADEESFRRVRDATRRVRSTPRVGAQRRRQVPVVGGGGLSCPDRNEIQHIHVLGFPTGGTFDLIVEIPNESGPTEESIEIDFDEFAIDVRDKLQTHAQIEAGDVTVIGGPLPGAMLQIEFTGRLAGLRVPTIRTDASDLTGGAGVGVVTLTVQDGFPKTEVEDVAS